jgi:hypothetical protein
MADYDITVTVPNQGPPGPAGTPAPQPLWAYKSTTQTNSTTDLVSDTNLTLAVEANKKYAVTALLGLDVASSGNNLRGKFLVPTSAQTFGTWKKLNGAAADNKYESASDSLTSETAFVESQDDITFIVQHFILVTGASSGNLTYQFASDDVGAESLAGSYLKAEIIP